MVDMDAGDGEWMKVVDFAVGVSSLMMSKPGGILERFPEPKELDLLLFTFALLGVRMIDKIFLDGVSATIRSAVDCGCPSVCSFLVIPSRFFTLGSS